MEHFFIISHFFILAASIFLIIFTFLYQVDVRKGKKHLGLKLAKGSEILLSFQMVASLLFGFIVLVIILIEILSGRAIR